MAAGDRPADTRPPCRFFASGECRFGESCRYSHVLPEGESDELCAFAVVGKCRFGASRCKHVHGLQCPRCLLFCLHPRDIARNERHLDECLVKDICGSAAPGGADSALECGLCRQRVSERSDPRFGLLECSHAFCLACIRQWRATQGEPARGDAPQPRSCPQCWKTTFLIVPSSRWIGQDTVIARFGISRRSRSSMGISR